MRERGHKRFGFWLSEPADATLRRLREETGCSFSELLDRLLLHPDAEACTRAVPDWSEPLF